MSEAAEDAAAIVARALSRRTPKARPRFLRELLAHTAAGLVLIEGDRAGGEAVYRLGGVLALFLARFERSVEGFDDRELWIVVGDLPPAHLVTDDAETPAEVLEAYCERMDDWADRVISKGNLSESFPVAAQPTTEHAEMLRARLEFIRAKLIPDA